MDQFFTLSYYFNPQPDVNFQFTQIVLIVGIALIVLGILAELYRKKVMSDKIARKILRPYPSKLMWYGVIALFLLAFREAGIKYLSMRIWWVVLLVFMLFSGLRLLLTYKSQYKKRTKSLTPVKKEDKYLPKKKK